MAKRSQDLEVERVKLQAVLDAEKTQAERNRMGQFATPPLLARAILSHAKTLLPRTEEVRFIDPAFGTGSFFSALLETFPSARIRDAVGFEIDEHYGTPAAKLWRETPLKLTLGDFTQAVPRSTFNLLICNPPYVRHHHLEGDEKTRLQQLSFRASGVRMSGLAGLYCHFMALSHLWLSPGGISAWLIPSEFMDVNYGQALKRYLLERVNLLHIHRFDPNDVQFSDALVSSAIVLFKNETPPADHVVTFSFGGTLGAPSLARSVPARALASETKWTRFPVGDVRTKCAGPTIADLFTIKRGLATGDNSYFILTEEEIETRNLPRECFTPILPSPRYLKQDEVEADATGAPVLDRRLFLLDVKISEEQVAHRYPALWRYPQEGRERGLHERYLCRHRGLWYAQEDRPAPPIACTYIGRGDTKSGRPFRFILNHSKATVANVYLAMYPRPSLVSLLNRDSSLVRRVWQMLNRITPEQLLGEGRVYGGGLHKLEPKELANVPLSELDGLVSVAPTLRSQSELF